jgi:hypothetical protein
MLLKKPIYILLSLMLLFVSTSCKKADTETISETSIQTEAQTEPAIEYKTIEPPEDGWTLELLNEVTYINGKDIDLPFCLNDLGEDFSYGDLKYNSENSRCVGSVYYKGDPAFQFVSQNFGNEFDGVDKIQYFSLLDVHNYSSLNLDSFIVFNGFSYNSSYEEMISCLGKYRDESIKYGYHYKVDIYDNAIFLIYQIEKSGLTRNLDSIFFNILEENNEY